MSVEDPEWPENSFLEIVRTGVRDLDPNVENSILKNIKLIHGGSFLRTVSGLTLKRDPPEYANRDLKMGTNRGASRFETGQGLTQLSEGFFHG